jgi:hypothetical protein
MDITEKDRIDSEGKKVTGGLTDEQFCIVYAVCHVMGMLSACANPVIYGYLNENFNREFKDIFEKTRACVGVPVKWVVSTFRRKSTAACTSLSSSSSPPVVAVAGQPPAKSPMEMRPLGATDARRPPPKCCEKVNGAAAQSQAAGAEREEAQPMLAPDAGEEKV